MRDCEAALVTGATGFLGRALVGALLDLERPVVALARDPSPLEPLRDPAWPARLRLAAGDLREPSSWAPFLAEVGAVFHLAAERSRPGARVREMEAVNREASVAFAWRAAEAGVERIVFVSSALAFGPSEGGEPVDERAEIDPRRAVSAYDRTRAEAALAIRGLVEEGGPVVSVFPAIVYGPDDPSHPNRVTSEVRRLLRTRVPVLVGGGRQARSLVHRDDVIAGLLAAERRALPGAELILAGEAATPAELAALVLELAGESPRLRVSIPAPAALAAARAMDFTRRFDAGSGYTALVQTLLREWRFDATRARRSLGFDPRPLREGLLQTLRGLGGTP
jgi:dihydroflavonol-4-reductase